MKKIKSLINCNVILLIFMIILVATTNRECKKHHMILCCIQSVTPLVCASWQPMLEIWKAMIISLWCHLLMIFSVWSACVWPETHNKSTAVERYSVMDVWKNTRSVPTAVLNVENTLSILLMILKEVSTTKSRLEVLHPTLIQENNA